MPLLHFTNLIMLQAYILNTSYKLITNSFELSNKDDQIFLNKFAIIGLIMFKFGKLVLNLVGTLESLG